MREDIVGGDYYALCPNCGEPIWSGRIETRIITEDGYESIFEPLYPDDESIAFNSAKRKCKNCKKDNIQNIKVVDKALKDIGKELITKGYWFSTNVFKNDAYTILFYDNIIYTILSEELENSDWECKKFPGIMQIKFNPKIENTVCNDYEINVLYSAIKKLPSKRNGRK